MFIVFELDVVKDNPVLFPVVTIIIMPDEQKSHQVTVKDKAAMQVKVQ